MEYYVESFWMGSWRRVCMKTAPKKAVAEYRKIRNFRNRELEIAAYEGRTISKSSGLRSELRIRRSDNVIILSEKDAQS